ncbi:unnamed protein product, partial [Rotaria magnacalcarata]
MNTFYLGNRQEFETKAYDYVSKSDAYNVLLNKDKGNGGHKWPPELNQMENEISLVPYITSKHSATWTISKYLNELLRPFVDKIVSTVFTKRELQSKTLFCAIKITNYHKLDIHKNMIDTVSYFLEENLITNKLEQVTIQNIKNLLHIFLYNNVFYYKDQIYTLTKGSP